MKTKWMLMAGLFSLALLLPATQYAGTTPNPNLIVRTYDVGDQAIKIQLANLMQETTVLTVESATTGEVVYSRTVRKHNGFNMRLSLKDTPEGRYILRIKQGEEERTQVISVQPEQLLLSQIN